MAEATPLLPTYAFISVSLPVFVAQQIGKGKAISLQAWTDHGGSRRLRLPDFKTFGT